MRIVAAMLTTLVVTISALGQQRSLVMTHPRLPDRAELERLNLKLGWATTLSLEGKRDTVATVQLFEQLLLVQLRSGLVSAYDAESGMLLWSVRPGASFPPLIPEGTADDRFVIVVRDVRMYGIGRQSGKLEWTFEMPTIPSSAPTTDGERVYICIGGMRLLAYDLPVRPGADKTVTEGLFVSSKQKPPVVSTDKDPKGSGEKQRYSVTDFRENEIRTSASVTGSTNTTPSISVLESVNPPYRVNSNLRQLTASLAVLPSALPPFRLNSDVSSTPAMTMINNITRLEEMSQKSTPPKVLTERWALSTNVRLSHAPRVTSGGIVVTSTERAVIASPKLVAQEFYRFNTANNITGPAGQFGDTLFVPTIDSSLYALDGLRGRVSWRYTAEGPLAQRAAVVGDDVFFTTVQGQLYRLDRVTGESQWKDRRGALDRFVPEVARFVSANDRFIYAQSRTGELLVLDRKRGLVMGAIRARDFTYSFANSVTDRIYLTANNGLLVCMYDRDLTSPQKHPQRDPNAPTLEGTPAEAKPIERPRVPLPGPPPEEKPKPKKDDKPADEKADKKGK